MYLLRNIPKNIKIIVAIIVMLVLFLVGYYIFLQATRTGKIAVDVATVPADASVDISGTNYGSANTIYLQPNTNYSVKINKNGF